jgi:hypothetical protein
MDTGTIVAVILGLLFGGVAFAYGGFSLRVEFPFLTILSYLLAVACVVSAILFPFLASRLPARPAFKETDGDGARTTPLATPPIVPTASPVSTELTGTPSQPAEVLPYNQTITPEYLVGLFKGRTEIQGQKLAASYVGKMEIEYRGAISEINLLTMGSIGVRLQSKIGTPSVTLFFDSKEWSDQLSALHHGDIITAIGTIFSASSTGIALDRCRIVSVGK